MGHVIINKTNVELIKNFEHFILITHSGVFHGDDVMSTALLTVALKRLCKKDVDITLVRTNNPDGSMSAMLNNTPTAVIVYDIGNGDFDHHGTPEYRDAMTDDSGKVIGGDTQLPYAAFGKLWRSFGPMLVEHDTWLNFDKHVATKIDLCDNGVETNPLSIFISCMNPCYGDDDSEIGRNKAFTEAVDIMEGLVDRWIEAQYRRVAARAEFCEVAGRGLSDDGTYCVMERYILADEEWINNHPELLFMLSPSARTPGAWNIHTVAKKKGSFEARKNLPKKWLDKYPEGCTFVHKGLFIGEFGTKEAAIAGAIDAVKTEEVSE